MPRFVVLHHITPPDFPRPTHYDFMLEDERVMRTWALPLEPTPGVVQVVEQIHDHRLDYFDYEGPISGGRGQVRRWDRGEYLVRQRSEAEWNVQLIGGSLVGTVRLRRLNEPMRWEFSFTR